jgi:adenylate cyclase
LQVQRRLAAIFSADVVGYSRLMADDEVATAQIVNTYREILGGLIAERGGRVVDAVGDNLLAEFPSVVDAVGCGLEIQRELRRRNADLAPERRMDFRIGIHLGDVMIEGDRIVGDGVNVAARVESLAEPGGVALSAAAFEQVEGKVPLELDDLGPQQLKNIARPVRVYRVLQHGATPRPRRSGRKIALSGAVTIALLSLVGIIAWWIQQSPPITDTPSVDDPALMLPRGPTIAVLPFANLTDDPAQEYFSDGLTEDIITGLSRFRELMVIARNSTLKYKGQAVDIKQVGRELGVRYVVEGSVRRDANTIRVVAQLLDASTATHLWADTYDRDLTADNIFSVQDDITGRVIGTIADTYGIIARAGHREIRAKGTNNLDAYDCVLRAYQYNHLHTAEEHLLARGCLERAIELDPDYAEAWAMLAYLYREEFHHGFNQRPQALDRALETAQRAVRLDSTNQNAHIALAMTHFSRRELDPFFVEAERALALNPNNGRALATIGRLTAAAGDWDRGVALSRKAAALNPYHPGWLHFTLSSDHYRSHEYEKALIEAQKVNLPSLSLMHASLAAIYGQLGREAEAQSALADLLELNPDFVENPRREFRKWYLSEELIEHFMDGLNKAGLGG